ncbi:MAG: FkbM family methyltransferase [Candidatus Sericytochromatia bacterium]
MQHPTINLVVQDIPFQLVIPEDNAYAQKFKRVYQERPGYEYEAVLSALLKKVLLAQAQPVYFDLGAFIGYFSFFPAKLLDEKHTVYAFESNPEHIELLQQGLKLNGLNNLEIIHAALSDQVETLRVLNNSVSALGNEGGLEIQAQTLDSICERKELRPTVIKMDIHGFEGKVLKGMQRILVDSLEYLFLELHPNVYLEKFTPGITRGMILDQLEAAGFHNYYVAGHRYSWSDGMTRFFDTGHFAYHELTRENRGQLLFDRHNQIFILAAKSPLPDLVGPSTIDPSSE